MAQEASKAKPAAEAIPVAGGSSGTSGWMPVIAVLVLVPALSYVMSEYVLFPKLEKRLAAAGLSSAPVPGAEAHGTETGHEAASSGAHGAESNAPKSSYEFKDVMSNLAGSMKSRYIKVSFTAYGSDEKFTELMERNRPKLLDATLGVLLSLNLADLEDPLLKKRVGMLLMQQFQTVLHRPVVEEIYFSDFLIQ